MLFKCYQYILHINIVLNLHIIEERKKKKLSRIK